MKLFRSSFLIDFLIFFLIISFVVTCNFLLFLHFSQVEYETLQNAAGITFLNVIFLSLLFTLIDHYRRKKTVTLPLMQIQKGINRVIQGDYTTPIQPVFREEDPNEFNQVIIGLNKMIKELSSVETLRSDFVANVSHELKTPLAIIQNYATLLESKQLTEKQRLEYTQIISQQTKRLSDLITNILKLNKLENQQIYPNIKKYCLNDQIIECLIEFELIWEKKQIQVEVLGDEDVMILANQELLSLVWHNLLSNAFKFTSEHGNVKITIQNENENVVVAIQDDGCGMTPDTGQHIFKRFYQGDTSHASSGNGLGLALVKKVMDICEGEIQVVSQLNHGSTFTVKLRRGYDETME